MMHAPNKAASVLKASPTCWMISSGAWPERWMSRRTRLTRSKCTPPLMDTIRSSMGLQVHLLYMPRLGKLGLVPPHSDGKEVGLHVLMPLCELMAAS